MITTNIKSKSTQKTILTRKNKSSNQISQTIILKWPKLSY